MMKLENGDCPHFANPIFRCGGAPPRHGDCPHFPGPAGTLRRGVTLIETLAAIALVAIVAPILSRAWCVTMDSAARSRDQVLAATLAETQLEDLLIAGDLTQAEQSGDFGDEHEGFRWEAVLYDWPEDSRFKELDVQVVWTRNDVEDSVIVSTIVDANAVQ
jgi:prepilin-type N-terminal cleavage/methylation domain-containing protein